MLPPTIRTLFLLGNPISRVPPAVAALPRLRMLSFKGCQLRRIDRPLPQTLVWLVSPPSMPSACEPAIPITATYHPRHDML